MGSYIHCFDKVLPPNSCRCGYYLAHCQVLISFWLKINFYNSPMLRNVCHVDDDVPKIKYKMVLYLWRKWTNICWTPSHWCVLWYQAVISHSLDNNLKDNIVWNFVTKVFVIVMTSTPNAKSFICYIVWDIQGLRDK